MKLKDPGAIIDSVVERRFFEKSIHEEGRHISIFRDT
jgi:hypothetical protein